MYFDCGFWLFSTLMACFWVQPLFYWLIDCPIAIPICLLIYYYGFKKITKTDANFREVHWDFVATIYLNGTIFLLTTLVAVICELLLIFGCE